MCTEAKGGFERQRSQDPLHSLAESFSVAVAGDRLHHPPPGVRVSVSERQWVRLTPIDCR